jgi:hypothetical protein
MTSQELDLLSKQGMNATIMPLHWVSLTAKSYSSFKDCYTNVILPKMEVETNYVNKYVRDFVTHGGFSLLSSLEENFDCASLCKVPLFYITKDISEGRPRQECIDGFIKGMNANLGTAGLFSILCAIILLIGALGTFPICCGGKEEKKGRLE